MPLSTEKLRGNPLKNRPEGISRCGMSIAKYAQHRDSQQWFELSSQGNIIGSPLQLDFYTHSNGSQPESRSREKELAKV
ncbi:MAG: hypothetical protein WA902_09300 [Thermosynechococcaceae cyanobacterium]